MSEDGAQDERAKRAFQGGNWETSFVKLALSKSAFAKFMNLKKPTDNKRKRGFVRKCYF